jgi:hypothetical protein
MARCEHVIVEAGRPRREGPWASDGEAGVTGALTGHARSTGEERRRFGKGHEKKAATAGARTVICVAWAVVARGQDYAGAGEDYCDQRDREHLIRHHQHALARLGCPVTLIPPGDSSPPPRPGSLTASPPRRQPSLPAPPALPRAWPGSPGLLRGLSSCMVTAPFEASAGSVRIRCSACRMPVARWPVRRGPGMAGLRYCAGSMAWLSREMLSGS